ncbi:UNVERIFIED_CONTAM: subtilase family protein [Acetivibrio alkalicellulosi]
MHYTNLNVAVIDDGVYENFFDVGTLIHKIEITSELNIINHHDFISSTPNHGSICAGIIKKFAPDASISSIKILNHERKGVPDQLVKAIDWCVESGIKIINLSLGTVYYKDSFKLRTIIKKASNKGIILVSACSNQSIITYPSYFSSVIGVKAGKVREGEYIYNYHPNDGIEITTSSTFELKQINGESFYTEACNSYATPFITAKVYNILKNNPKLSVEKVKHKMMENALNKSEKTQFPYLYKTIDWVENVIIFNINFTNMNYLNTEYFFNIAKVINFTANCFCDAAKCVKDHLSSNIDQYDTVIIIGSKLASNHSDCSSDNILQAIIDSSKNIVYLDDKDLSNKIDVKLSNEKLKIWHPSVFNYLNNPMLKKVDVPLVTINDFTGNYLLGVMKGLNKCFFKDEYNPICATETCLGILYEFIYAPLFNDSILSEYDPAGLKAICGLYTPDILLYGIDAVNKSASILEYKSKLFDTDIDIIIAFEHNSIVDEYICLLKKTDCHIILLTPFTMKNNNIPINKDIKSFDLYNKNCINDLYNYIIHLYNK